MFPQPNHLHGLSPVQEGSEEGSSPRGSVSDNGNLNGSEITSVTRSFVEPQEKSSEELLRRESNKKRGGVSFLFVIFIGVLGIILGYLMKKT